MEDVIQVIEFWASIFRLVRAAILAMQAIKLLLDSLANPTDYKHRLAVANRLVARTVRAFFGRLAAIGDQGVVIRKPHQTLAFDWGKSSHGSAGLDLCSFKWQLRHSLTKFPGELFCQFPSL